MVVHHEFNINFIKKNMMLKTTLTGDQASFSLSFSVVQSDPSCIHIGLAWGHVVFETCSLKSVLQVKREVGKRSIKSVLQVPREAAKRSMKSVLQVPREVAKRSIKIVLQVPREVAKRSIKSVLQVRSINMNNQEKTT